MRAILIRGVCSLCAKEVRGAGADEFEALGDAETEHFAATLCLGEPTEIKKGVRQSNGTEVFTTERSEAEIASFASAFKSFRLAGVSMKEATANARRFDYRTEHVYSATAMAPCGCPEERHALGLPCPPPLPAPDLDLFPTVQK